MRIGVHLLTLEPGKIGGMEQYIRNLIWFTIHDYSQYEFFLFLNERNAHTFHEEKNVKKIIISEDPKKKEIELYQGIINNSIDLWFCPLLNLEPKYLTIPSVVTIPDMQHEFYPKYFSRDVLEWRRKNLQLSAKRADAILTLSEFSKQSIVQYLNVSESKVHAIYLDASKEFYQELSDEKYQIIKEKFDLPDQYGFYPANTWPHKNHIALLQALTILRDRYGKKINIVLTGSQQQASEKVNAFIKKNGLASQVKFLGYIHQEEMPYVYMGASFLVFPSLFEGFGIPLVEAMKTKTPIVCSDKGSIPEVVGDSAICFDATDPEDIAAKILEILDEKTRTDLVKKAFERAGEFSWKITTKKTIDIFNQLVEEHQSRKLNDYPLVTVVTPSYNQGKFIKETIESVLSQDYPNIEYIVMDGGSTDETAEILKSYNDRIQWVSEKDDGQADAVNKGVLRAHGEIIGWLNSDDTYLPGAVKHAVEFLMANPDVGMVYGEGYYTNENGEIIDRYPTESFDYDRLAQNCFICQPTAFIRKSVLESVGLLNKDLHLCMDYELWMRIGKDYNIAYIPYFFATSRMYEDNKTLSRRKEVFTEIIQTVREHYGYVPISWVYGYVDYLRGPKRDFLFYVSLLLRFFAANRRNPSYFLNEIRQMVKAKLKYLIKRSQPFTGQYLDGWVSRRFSTVFRLDKSIAAKQAFIKIKGRHLAPYKKTLKIKIFANGQFINEHAIIHQGEFEIAVPILLSGDEVNLTLIANRIFIPKKLGISEDNRELAYLVDKITIEPEASV
jgi:glycosyltransferase involved in cell wall biosynthesis